MTTKNSTRRSSKTAKPSDTVATNSSNLPQVDTGTAALMAVAGLVSGWMSYNGAAEIFNDDLMAFGFTIVVQGVVTLALWYFAVAKGMQRFLLASVWAVAVTFSIGTAFVKTDKTNDGSVIAQADIELASYEAAINAEIIATSKAASSKQQEADAEAANGGCGPICRGLQAEAAALVKEAEFYVASAGQAIEKSAAARASLGENADLAALLGIYQELKTEVGDLANDIPDPAFISMTSRSAFDRIASALARVSGGEEGLDVATLGAVWVACLMELLAVACAMIRLSSRIEPSDTPIEKRAEYTLAWMYDLKTLPARVQTLAIAKADAWKKDNKSKPASTSGRATASNRTSNGSIKTDQEFWTEGLHAQADASEVPLGNLVLTMIQEISTVTVQGNIDQKLIDKHSAVRSALVHTGVITQSKNGLVASEKWIEWTGFLFEEHRRQRQHKTTTGTTRLRQVA